MTGPEALRRLLSAFAGRMPDDGLAVMRTCLADGEADEAARMLADALRSGRLPITDAEADLAAEAFAAYGEEPGVVDVAARVSTPPAHRYRFEPPAALAPAGLTALLAATAPVGGLHGVWRTDRTSAVATVPVWLAEAGSGADVLELTAEAQHALAETGEIPPRVEVFTPDDDLSPYHQQALAGASLVWTDPALPEPRLARAFDGADPDTGPYFDPDHPTVTGVERQRLLEYLNGADVLLTGFGVLDDLLDPTAIGTVPVSFRSDGRWIWTDSVGYYLLRHDLAPDPELRAHVLSAAGPPGRLGPLAAHRAIAVLTAPEPDGGEVAWQPA